jgi:hypothetical protein
VPRTYDPEFRRWVLELVRAGAMAPRPPTNAPGRPTVVSRRPIDCKKHKSRLLDTTVTLFSLNRVDSRRFLLNGPASGRQPIAKDIDN